MRRKDGGGKDWDRDELHRSSGPFRYDNRSNDSRPLPKEQIVGQGIEARRSGYLAMKLESTMRLQGNL